MVQTVAASRFGQGIARGSSGKFTGDGTAVTVVLGFRPSNIRLANLTDATVWEKHADMTDAQCLKTVTAGTLTTDTSSAIVINDRGFVVSAAAGITAKAFTFIAE